MKKRDINYERHDILTHDDFKKDKLTVQIIQAPRIVKTKYTDDQPMMIVKIGTMKRAWFANWSSMNSLIEKFGENEILMVGAKIDLELVNKKINGTVRKVIYPEGLIEPDKD